MPFLTNGMTREEVEKLAALARLDLTEAEAVSLAKDIESILGYVSEIQEVATEEPKPEVGAHYNVTRADGESHEGGAFTDALLAEAPERKANFIKVKKIIQND